MVAPAPEGFTSRYLIGKRGRRRLFVLIAYFTLAFVGSFRYNSKNALDRQY
jgi:hypothetical protein